MEKYKIIHNAETGKITEVPLTAEEIADLEQIATNTERRMAEEKARKDARRSALSKLIDLGLTEEEIAAL